tara:strand:+ start:956 stop:1459 length:504 start_codon:yes stop_codon:yes gene_type:complete
LIKLNKYFKFSLFLLIFLSAFNGLNLFGIQDLTDISLVLTVLLATNKTSKFELSIFVATLLLLQVFGDPITLYDSFVKVSLIFIAIYLNKFFIWNSERNEILLTAFLLILYYLLNLCLLSILGDLILFSTLRYLFIKFLFSFIILTIMLFIFKYIQWPSQQDQTYQF